MIIVKFEDYAYKKGFEQHCSKPFLFGYGEHNITYRTGSIALKVSR